MSQNEIELSDHSRPPRRVLLTSVCRPLGESHGDGPSVGYELLFGQVTRAQGLFSPRSTHLHFALDYVAENLDAPTTVLQYPSRRELIRELRKGYDVVGVSFLLATFHRMKECVELIREHCPKAAIVLGGYGTVLSDEVLRPYADHICREEGVAFMRQLLGEEPIARPYRHPLVVSRLRLFGREVSRTGIVFGGLGCPNGCDFCCTSHFFRRRHIKLLPTGRDLYNVMMRYQDFEPGMSIVILDEDFLLDRKRAMELRQCVIEGGVPLSIFAFASVRALSMYTVEELLETGLDGFWIGYEGTASGYAKQKGRDIGDLFRELRAHGVTILTSMIVGFPYQTLAIIEEELKGLLSLEPTFCQFLIYGPTPGTPFHEQVVNEGLLDPALAADNERYYRSCTGFSAMVQHPSMSGPEIEAAQQRCFDEDYQTLGPSVFRSVEVWLNGYRKLKESPVPILRAKAARFARELRRVLPMFAAGRLLGPNAAVRRRIGALERRVHAAVGAPRLGERLQSVAAVALAAWTGVCLRLGWFQHPRLVRHVYRTPDEALPARIWRGLHGADPDGHLVEVELRAERTVWVRLKGSLRPEGAERLGARLKRALEKRREHLVIDLQCLASLEGEAVERLRRQLEEYRHRIQVALPRTTELAALAALFSLYR